MLSQLFKDMDKKTLKFILNVLRQGTITWNGRSECLKRARKKVLERVNTRGKEIYKFYWTCAKCKKEFRDESSMEVDHIEEVGPYAGDLHKYAERLYCPIENLQALCISCHARKTAGFNARLRYTRKSEDLL